MNGEGDDGWRRADMSILDDGLDDESVAAGTEACVIDRRLGGQRAPIAVGAFELIPEPQALAERKGQAGEIDLDLILTPPEFETSHLCLLQFRNGVSVAGDPQSRDQDWRR